MVDELGAPPFPAARQSSLSDVTVRKQAASANVHRGDGLTVGAAISRLRLRPRKRSIDRDCQGGSSTQIRAKDRVLLVHFLVL